MLFCESHSQHDSTVPDLDKKTEQKSPEYYHVYAKLLHARCTDNLSVFLVIGSFPTEVFQLGRGLKFEETNESIPEEMTCQMPIKNKSRKNNCYF